MLKNTTNDISAERMDDMLRKMFRDGYHPQEEIRPACEAYVYGMRMGTRLAAELLED